jgi:pericentriolar material 1 protein
VDTRELDEQIKGVINQVFPVIKEHINDAFSPQLLAYIQRLVLSLVRQPGHTHEFARFFYGQLASILQDSLKKFEGRRSVFFCFGLIH